MRTKESYALEPLHSADEDAGNIDELLYEAVERNSTKSVNALLTFVFGGEKQLKVEDEQSQKIASSSISVAWKKKVNVKAVILAARKGHYDLIKLFLSRGFRIDAPHDILCGCYTCKHDPLGSTKARIMTYSAISNPMWIALTSEDPFLTAFTLSRELTLLQNVEDSYENAFSALKAQVQTFCMELLDCVESATDQFKLVNMIEHIDCSDEDVSQRPDWSLKFIKCAFTYKLKKIVAHPVLQHAVTSLVYEGCSKFWVGSRTRRFLYIAGKSVTFPITALAYLFFPCSTFGRSSQAPLVRFISGASSFVTFLGLLALLSALPANGLRLGEKPSSLEWVIFIWIISLLVAEISQLSHVGRHRYFTSGWNLMDLFMIFFMLTSYCIWGVLFLIQSPETNGKMSTVRSIANGLFTCGTIMSFFRLVYLCQITRFLGLLQLCLGRMIEVIFQFAFISFVVLWSFSVGMVFLHNSLNTKGNDRHLQNELLNKSDVQVVLSKGFNGLPATMVTLAWASMNMVGLGTLQGFDDGGVVYLWSAFLFTLYYMVSMIVLLNMLIAMMSNSYQQIENNIEVEHKFAKTQLLVDYITVKSFLPCPFNLIPTWHCVKRLAKMLCGRTSKFKDFKERQNHERETEYGKTVKTLVERYLRKKLKLNAKTHECSERSKHDLNFEFDERVKNFLCRMEQKESPRKKPSFEDSGLDISFNGDHGGDSSNSTHARQSVLVI